MPQPSIHLRFLGQYAIAVGDRPLPPFPTDKRRSLFACLALRPVAHTRSHLAGLFWPELPEKSARRRLTQELWRVGLLQKGLSATDEHG